MTNDPDATGDGSVRPVQVTANLFLPESDGAQVCDHGSFATLRLGDRDNYVSVFAAGAGSARELADAATVWAEMTEAHDRGDKVEQWCAWVLPSAPSGVPGDRPAGSRSPAAGGHGGVRGVRDGA